MTARSPFRYYLFFTRNALPQPRADLVQVTNCANAAANLGYPTVLAYLQRDRAANHPIAWIAPQIRSPNAQLQQFYHLQARLQTLPLPIPQWCDRVAPLHPSRIACKYYLPLHLKRITQLVHTRDWNFAKAAVLNGIAAIYEHHHHEDKQFEASIVQHPLFQIAVTVADSVRDRLISQGMPAAKVVKIHNGFNRAFLDRQPQAAQAWRDRLLTPNFQHLVVYAGALYPFKGVDLLLQVARSMPQVQFAFAGGSADQVQSYQQQARDRSLQNVMFLGFLPQAQLASLLQAADVLAHPHTSGAASTFTSPLKFFEYLAANRPIVATEIASLKEFRSLNLVAGWCEPDNPTQFQACLEHLLRRRYGRFDRQAIESVQQFSWENRIQKILSYVDPIHQPRSIA
ncbi:glycosyltransferase [Microcoleus sp. FACHB-1515]|uniref:glycosyltransferase n=1 Tax=Cyanophyceae TaxID=3028117 RepID=UPI001687812A|nr:glycosyltransferase [Microcoleus sp. FACHB-1515]MBD2089692.1 glycosyltransferase [Microcoleus sp. FACHB-1515]